MSGITVPVLAILGEQDNSLSNVKRLAEVYPSTKIVTIPGKSHIDVFFDSEFDQSVQTFLFNVEHMWKTDKSEINSKHK